MEGPWLGVEVLLESGHSWRVHPEWMEKGWVVGIRAPVTRR